MPFTSLFPFARHVAGPGPLWADAASMREAYDVVVIGGGVRALAQARACALDGATVALLAPGEIAASSDERAWPVIRAGKQDAHRAIDLQAVQLARRASRGSRSRVGMEQAGCLTIAGSSHEVDLLAKRVVEMKAGGFEAWMVPAREIEALSPPLAGEAFPAALFEQGAEIVDPDALALSLAEGAAAAGAELFAFAQTTALERGDDATGLRVGDVSIAAGAVVLAEDQSAIRLIREGKGRLSLVRDERTLLRSLPGAPAIGPAIELGEIRIVRDRAGALVVSGPRGGDAVARDLVAVAPSLGGVEIAADEPFIVWRGVDGLPQVGPTERPGVWLALGFGRDALALALPAAEHLAALIAGRRGVGGFEPFAPTRQPGRAKARTAR